MMTQAPGKEGKVDVGQAIRKRRSIRKFSSDPLTEEEVREIITAGVWAPSAGNAQPWKFIVVRDAALKDKLVAVAHGQRFVAEAPVVIVVCADVGRARRAYGERGATLYCLQDTAAATQNILLAATAKGYGTCWVGAFDEEKAREVLNLPPGLRAVALVPVGKPREEPEPRSRRPLHEVVEHR